MPGRYGDAPAESAARNMWAADGPIARLMWIARAGERKYGVTIDEIIRRWNVSRRTAQRDLARLRRIGYVAYAADPTGTIDAYRLEPPWLVVATGDATLVATMRAYQETQSVHVAAKRLGVSHETVRLRLRTAKERGFAVLLPHEAQRERKLRKEAQRQAHRDAKRAAKRDYVEKLVEELREISRQLGYVPSVTTLVFGPKPGAQRRRERGEHVKLYAALRRSQSVPKLLDIISAELGLPRERRKRRRIADEQKPTNAEPKRTRRLDQASRDALRRARARERAKVLRAENICVICKHRPARVSRTRCADCAAAHSVDQARRQGEAHAKGMCTTCMKQPARPGRKSCETCLTLAKQRFAKSVARRRHASTDG